MRRSREEWAVVAKYSSPLDIASGCGGRKGRSRPHERRDEVWVEAQRGRCRRPRVARWLSQSSSVQVLANALFTHRTYRHV
jgi:hypothetical protein